MTTPSRVPYRRQSGATERRRPRFGTPAARAGVGTYGPGDDPPIRQRPRRTPYGAIASASTRPPPAREASASRRSRKPPARYSPRLSDTPPLGVRCTRDHLATSPVASAEVGRPRPRAASTRQHRRYAFNRLLGAQSSARVREREERHFEDAREAVGPRVTGRRESDIASRASGATDRHFEATPVGLQVEWHRILRTDGLRAVLDRRSLRPPSRGRYVTGHRLRRRHTAPSTAV